MAKRTKEQEAYVDEWMRTGSTGQMMAERRRMGGRRVADTRVMWLTIACLVVIVLYILLDHLGHLFIGRFLF